MSRAVLLPQLLTRRETSTVLRPNRVHRRQQHPWQKGSESTPTPGQACIAPSFVAIAGYQSSSTLAVYELFHPQYIGDPQEALAWSGFRGETLSDDGLDAPNKAQIRKNGADACRKMYSRCTLNLQLLRISLRATHKFPGADALTNSSCNDHVHITGIKLRNSFGHVITRGTVLKDDIFVRDVPVWLAGAV